MLDAIGNLTTAIASVSTEVKEDYKHTRTTLIAAAIGVLALVVAVQATLLTAFQTGVTLHTVVPGATIDQTKK